MERRLKRKETYVYIQLIHVVVQQKLTYIIVKQLSTNFKTNYKICKNFKKPKKAPKEFLMSKPLKDH